MTTQQQTNFPALDALFDTSLFSETELPHDFFSTKALATIELCKDYMSGSNSSIHESIKKLMLESFAINIGLGDNYGSCFPFTFLEKIKDKLSGEIDKDLILEIVEWEYGITDMELIIISKHQQEACYFFENKKTNDSVSYNTMSVFAYNAIYNNFLLEHERLNHYVKSRIPRSSWREILEDLDELDKFLE